MSAPDTKPPRIRRQYNVRLDTDLWDELEARRLQAGLSRDAWADQAFRHLLATTTLTPQETPHGTHT